MGATATKAGRFDFLVRDPNDFLDDVLKGVFKQVTSRKKKNSSIEEFEKILACRKIVSQTKNNLIYCKDLARHLRMGGMFPFDHVLQFLKTAEDILDQCKNTRKEIYSSPTQFLLKLYRHQKSTAQKPFSKDAWVTLILKDWKRLQLIESSDKKHPTNHDMASKLEDLFYSAQQNISKKSSGRRKTKHH